MPFRIDWRNPPEDGFDRLIALGALDVDVLQDGVAAILPDSAGAATIATALGARVRVTKARGRDDDSVWVLKPGPIRVGPLQIIPPDRPPQPGALRLLDGPAFGTGLHPTTVLCLEALHQEVEAASPGRILDVGTGSGVLALGALIARVPHAVAIDTDLAAVHAAAANARLNELSSRLHLVCGGVEAVTGAWPLVLANILTAPLMAMAPALSRHLARRGRLVLSGIRASLADDVIASYRRVGLQHVGTDTREGWAALTFQASW